jgi:carbamate kinase
VHRGVQMIEGPRLIGVEAVIDKDFASELLVRELDADLFVMLTDADAVYLDWGKRRQRGIRRAPPAKMAEFPFPAGSHGPEGRGGVPVRGAPRQACRYRRAGGPAGNRSRRGRHDRDD